MEPNRTMDVATDDRTALFTFFLNVVPGTHSVDLLGSWDNFSVPYPMVKDSRRGRGLWRGIHDFKNIICDGDLANVDSSRDGALRTGGLYWYYYRLNGDLEHHNPCEPSTTACPLLPGQRVNILDVPVELPCNTPSGLVQPDLTHCMTLNPKDRWAPLKRKRKETPNVTPKAWLLAERRKEYLEKSLGRKSTAVAHKSILASQGYEAHKWSGEELGWSDYRPKSCTQLPNDVHLFRSDTKRFSLTRSWRLSSQERQTTTADFVAEQDQDSPGSASTRKNASSFLRYESNKESQLLPASRPQTVGTSLSATGTMIHASSSRFEEASSQVNLNRSNSAPAKYFPLGRSIARAQDSTESAEHCIALPRLETMQLETNGLDDTDTRALGIISEDFSEIFDQLQSAPEDHNKDKSFEHGNALSPTGDVCHSPTQMSYSSRRSTLGTRDTGSTHAGSDTWDASQRASFRFSLQSALTVYDDDGKANSGSSNDQNTPDTASGDNTKAGGAPLGLGVQFSSLVLGSQETIKPARAFAVDPQPLDNDWNPFSKLARSQQQQDEEEAASLYDRLGGEPLALAAVGNSNKDERGEMMNDLSFLGAAIA